MSCGRTKIARLSGAVLLISIILPFGLPPSSRPPHPPGQFWQIIIRLQINSDFIGLAYEQPAGSYLLEIDWVGFLEEDGLDFIIYHLGSGIVRWEFSSPAEKTGATNIPVPEFKLDYVEGKEEIINFYYSFNPETVACPGISPDSQIRLPLPAIGWSPSGERKFRPKRKIISGRRELSLQRSRLEKQETRQEFSWEEEIELADSRSLIIRQRSQVRITLELIRCKLGPDFRPGDENDHKYF